MEIETLVESCVYLLEDQCEQAGLHISVTLEPGLPAVMADAGRTKQVLLNLLSNSVKFTPSGGRLSVDVRAAGENVRIDVTDTGIGMSPDDISVALEPFNPTFPRWTPVCEETVVRVAYRGNFGGGAGRYSPGIGGNRREHRDPSPLMASFVVCKAHLSRCLLQHRHQAPPHAGAGGARS